MVSDILQQRAAENVDFSEWARKRPSSSRMLFRGVWRERIIYEELGHQKGSCWKAENVLSNLRLQSKWKTQEIDQGAQVQETIPQKDKKTPKTGRSPSGEEDRSPSFNHERGNCRDDRDCDYWHLLHCKFFKNDKCEMWKDCLFVYPANEEATYQSSTKGKREGNIIRQRRSIGFKTGYCKSQCPLDSHRKPWACTRDTLMHHRMIIGLPSGIQEKKCIVDSGAYKTADLKRREIFSERDSSQRPWSSWDEISNTVQRRHHWKVSCDFWHPPECQHYKTLLGSRFGEKCVFMHREVDRQLNKKPKKTSGEVCAAIWSILSCEFPGCRAAEIQFDLTERHRILGADAQREILKGYVAPHENLWKEGSMARCDSAFWSSGAQAFVFRNLRTDLRYDALAETRGKWQKLFASAEKRTKLHSTRLQRFGVHQSTILNETRGLRICCRFRSLDDHAAQARSEFSRTGDIRVSRNPTMVITANGEVQIDEEATVYVYEKDLFVTAQILEGYASSSVARKSAKITNTPMSSWPVVKNHTSFKTVVIQCNTGNYVPVVVPGLSTGPPSSTLNIGTAGPNNRRFSARSSTTRSQSTRSRARWDLLHSSTEIKNKNRNQDIDATLGRRSHDLPEWLEFFTVKLVGDEGSASSDALARFSRESPHQESSRKVVSGNQGVFINTLPEGAKLQSMQKLTKNDKHSLQQTPW